MRLNQLRSSSEHRRRSCGSVTGTADPGTIYMTQEGYIGHVEDRRRSLAEPLIQAGVQKSSDMKRRSSSLVPSSGRVYSNRIIQQTSGFRVKSFPPLNLCDSDMTDGLHDSLPTKQMEESYELNAYRIKIIIACFVIILLVSLFMLYRRAIGQSSLGASM
ncbi:hypothetical protein PoB_006220600 [Plakobranchus ocellatus]|uniref:LEM domain-containing protein n=1 Tax=Plakobranchus ocellatus TaxID=259542 RepID=A0AAV4CVI2_9GAST|nr:hypothetical protein PoB_006220600 [Plakobranchus ocellatus]